MKMEEMMHMSKNNKVGILVGLGMLRDVMPWMYDIGIETLRKIDSNCSIKEKEQSLREFRELIKITSRHPMIREMMDFDSNEDFIMYEEIPRILMHAMERYFVRKRK
jgi:hypothetical protein